MYPVISQFFRRLFGWLPFSIGEFLYLALVIIAVHYVIVNRIRIGRKPLIFLRNLAVVLSVAYLTFNLVWGLNYYRRPLTQQFNIRDSVTTTEVITLAKQLIRQTNSLQVGITGDTTKGVEVPYTHRQIFSKTLQGYEIIEKQYPFLTYEHANLKAGNSGAILAYLGIGGYLNPFTSEAQVNALTPAFRLPVVTAHEIGHQVGYAKENETNFIGYLVTLKNDDIYFQYAAAAYALSHCLSAIKRVNIEEFEHLSPLINAGVWQNYQELFDFNLKYDNPFEPVFKSVFSTFLKANQQRDGIKSYSKIVQLMVGYHEKFPIFSSVDINPTE